MVRAVAAVVVLVTVGAVVTGCSGDDAPDPGLHATLQRSTLFETRRALRLALTATVERDVQIDGVQLRTPLFEPVDPEDRDTVLQPDDHGVVLPLPFGPARCGDDVAEQAADHPPELVTRVDGEEVRVDVEVRPSGVLTALHAAECRATEVLEDVELRFGPRWEQVAPRTVVGEVELVQRRDGVTAAVDEVGGNLLFNVTPEGQPAPWLEVGDDRSSARIGVEIEAARCDPHAITEYKRKYVFTAQVRIGDEEAVRVDVRAEGEGRRILEQQLAGCLS